jgi:hypothetical protein
MHFIYFQKVAFSYTIASDLTCSAYFATNDAALPIGGKFDINGTWSGAHAEHNRGSAVDIANTTMQCSAAETVAGNVFGNACFAAGAVSVIVHTDHPHVHCNWQRVTSYSTN